jgi:hypothetical protein
MGNEISVSGSLSEFLKDGVEAAECSICAQPFDSTQHLCPAVRQHAYRHSDQRVRSSHWRRMLDEVTEAESLQRHLPDLPRGAFREEADQGSQLPKHRGAVAAAQPLPPTLF